MTPEQWKQVKHFHPSENWGDPEKMDAILIFGLDALRDFVGLPITIHCGWEKRNKGFHPDGIAADLHIEGISAFDQFIAAQRFSVFTGIGIYPRWTNFLTGEKWPGVHLDTRPLFQNEPRALWGCLKPGYYDKVGKHFLMASI